MQNQLLAEVYFSAAYTAGHAAGLVVSSGAIFQLPIRQDTSSLGANHSYPLFQLPIRQDTDVDEIAQAEKFFQLPIRQDTINCS